MIQLIDQYGKTFEVSQDELYELVSATETLMERWPQQVNPEIENGLYKYLSQAYKATKSNYRKEAPNNDRTT